MNGHQSTPSETNLEAGGFVKGVALALVTQNKDPEGLARVKLSYPWRSGSSESDWVRIAVPMAGNNRGMVFIPEVGDEVLVTFERGDMRFPYVIGGLWNGKDKPPESNANGQDNLRIIQTRKGHTLLFDDNSAKGRIELKLNDGKKLSIDDDGITLDDGSGNSLAIDSKDGVVTLQAATELKLKAPSITLESANKLTLNAVASVTVKSAMVYIN